MPSRQFPSDGSRYVIHANGDRATSESITYFTDSLGQTLADVFAERGTDTPDAADQFVGSTTTLDAYGGQVDFRGPTAGTKTLYAQVGADGPIFEVPCKPQPQLDDHEDRLVDLEAGGDGDALLVHKAGAEAVAGVKTFSSSPVVPTPSGGTDAANKTYVDTADALLVPKTYRLPLNAMTTQNRGAPPRIVSLIAGTEDETKSSGLATIAADTTNYKVGGQGWQMTMAGAQAGRLTVTPISPATSGLLTVPAAQAVCLWIYLPDATKVTTVTVTLYQDAGNAVQWSRSNTSGSPSQSLVTGWNLLRWAAYEGTTTSWSTLNRADVQVVTNAATTATVGHLYLECPEKAKLLFILDRGYKTFVTLGGLARMRASQIPITWALDPTLLGTSTGTINEVVTEADIATYAAAGDSISFHSWDGSVTSAYTAAQCRTDTARAVKWLQARGYRGRMWRAAWTQNAATNASAINDLVVAQATSDSSSSLAIWPPRNRWNIPRWGVHGRTTADIDTRFDLWQATNSVLVVYTHGIDDAGGNNITPTLFDYFMTKVEAGIAAGWIEGTTFEQLWAESGFQWGDISGGTTLQTFDKGAAVLGQTL